MSDFGLVKLRKPNLGDPRHDIVLVELEHVQSAREGRVRRELVLVDARADPRFCLD